mmetsp:Transcript_53465/g.141786  ORF Transcript_53465/g.141786 Transcript_53465/m.141786 type:complete len:590 (-) Transcript_53465:106-1875(-)
MSLTDNLKLCDEDGQLGLKEFEVVMRRQMRQLVQSKLVLTTLDRAAEESDFMIHGPLKVLLMEQALADQRMTKMAEHLQMIICKLCPDGSCGSPISGCSSPLFRISGRDQVSDMAFGRGSSCHNENPSPSTAIGSQMMLQSNEVLESLPQGELLHAAESDLVDAPISSGHQDSSAVRPPRATTSLADDSATLLSPHIAMHASSESDNPELERLLLHEVRRMASALQDLSRQVHVLGTLCADIREVKSALKGGCVLSETTDRDTGRPQAHVPIQSASRRLHRHVTHRTVSKGVNTKITSIPNTSLLKHSADVNMATQNTVDTSTPSQEEPATSLSHQLTQQLAQQLAQQPPHDVELPSQTNSIRQASDIPDPPSSSQNSRTRLRTGSILRHTRIGDPEPTEPVAENASIAPALHVPKARIAHTGDPSFWLRHAPSALEPDPSAGGAGRTKEGTPTTGWSGPSVARRLTAACGAALPRLRSLAGSSTPEVEDKGHVEPASAAGSDRAAAGVWPADSVTPTSARFVFEPLHTMPSGDAESNSGSEQRTGRPVPRQGGAGRDGAPSRAVDVKAAWRAAQGAPAVGGLSRRGSM